MTLEEKIEFIDDFLARCEDWMHDEDGEDVTKCRKYLIDIEVELDVGGLFEEEDHKKLKCSVENKDCNCKDYCAEIGR